MIIINPTELRKDQKKYLDLAEKEQVVIKRGKKLIELVVRERLITDKDMGTALTGDQLLQEVIPGIKKIFDKR